MFNPRLLKHIVLVSCLVLSGTPAFAAQSGDTNDLIKKITDRTQELEQQVKSLKAQVAQLKKDQQQTTVLAEHASGKFATTPKKSPTIIQEVRAVQQAEAKESSIGTGSEYLHTLGGVPVLVSPYIGAANPSYDGLDLMTNASKWNTDVRLLQQRRDIENSFIANGLEAWKVPVIELSGKLEPQYIWARNYTGPHSGSFDLSSGELDVIAHINGWVTGFLGFSYDNSAFNAPPSVNNSPLSVPNSPVRLNRGFVTVGNLKQTPLYVTLGQNYVPFGHYVSYMVSSPLTLSVFRTRARMGLVGYQPMGDNGVYGSVYAFRGPSNPTAGLNQVGADTGYRLKNNSGFKMDVGGGAIANIADSDGFQTNGLSSPYFAGFGATSSSETLRRRVGGYNIHTVFSWNDVMFIGEYLRAAQKFSATDLSFNGHGARPSALQLELAYNFQAFGKPNSFAVGYNNTRQAVALNLPKERYIATYNISLWRSTIQSIEFRRDRNYANSTTGTGLGGTSAIVPTGGFSNTVTAQFGVYF